MSKDSSNDAILAVVSRIEEGQKRQDARLDRMDKRLAEVEKIALFGRGAAWMLFRMGVLVGAAIGIWEGAKRLLEP